MFCGIISIRERIGKIDKELQNKCQGTTKIGRDMQKKRKWYRSASKRFSQQ